MHYCSHFIYSNICLPLLLIFLGGKRNLQIKVTAAKALKMCTFCVQDRKSMEISGKETWNSSKLTVTTVNDLDWF